jgi:hypothetical protein
MKQNKEGNPVPLLNNEELKAIEIVIKAFKGTTLNYLMATQAYSKLKHGVETDNKQPKEDISFFSRYKD